VFISKNTSGESGSYPLSEAYIAVVMTYRWQLPGRPHKTQTSGVFSKVIVINEVTGK